MNFVIITAIIVSKKKDPIIMAYDIVIPSVAQAIFTYVIAKIKKGYQFKSGINLNDKYLRPMLIDRGPIIVGLLSIKSMQ